MPHEKTSPNISAEDGKSRRSARKALGREPAGLALGGILAGWDPRWKVGYVLGDDGVERSVAQEAFGPLGIEKARKGLPVAFSVRPDGAVLACGPKPKA